jgi:integrase
MHFCEQTGLSPEEFLGLDRSGARDVVWKFVKLFIAESTSKAKNNLAALKSFYRSQDGQTLPFDSRRGGKHYFNSKKRKKAALEHVPNRPEMYRIIDAAINLRDNTMLLMLFQSGIRENAVCHLKFKHVKDQLYSEPKIPLRLRITDQIDTKLRGYIIDFYDTFLQGEAIQKLKACESAKPL